MIALPQTLLRRLPGHALALTLAIPASFCRAADAPADPPAGPDASLVEILVAFQEHDPFLPWQKRTPGRRRGYGVSVDGSRVLTVESLVRNATLVELRRAGRGEKMAAAVENSDCRVDCALLSVREPGAAMPPLPIAERVAPGAEVEILQFDETQRPQRGKGRVIQVAMKELPYAPYPSLTMDVLTDLDINGDGAAVILDGKLAGLLMKYDSGSRTGAMLPACLLRRFHEDVKQSPYEGFASAGFLWKDLVDPAKRAWLGVTDPGRGVQVLACVPGSGAADALRPGDVVLRWDSFDVDNLGFYEDPDFGRLALSYLVLGRRRPGDAVPCVIVRDKRRIETQVKLGRWSDGDALIPENVEGARAAYLVEGGLILQELSGKYLKAYGGRWEQRVDPRLSHAYTTSRLAPEKPGDRIVVLSGVLPDTANIGYEGFRDAVVTAVNGQPVRNLADVFRAVDRDGCVYRVSLQSVGTDLVLDRASLEEANARLARQYRITQRSWRGGPDK